MRIAWRTDAVFTGAEPIGDSHWSGGTSRAVCAYDVDMSDGLSNAAIDRVDIGTLSGLLLKPQAHHVMFQDPMG